MILALLIFVPFAQAIPSDPLAGGAGWVGAGLLGAVLSWLMFVHLPAKDKQIGQLLELGSKERELREVKWEADRERERTTRHETANMFQRALADVVTQHWDALKELRADGEKDRMAFIERSIKQEAALRDQTALLLNALRSTCRMNIAPFPPPEDKP